MILDDAQAQQEAVEFLREIHGEINQLLGIDFASVVTVKMMDVGKN